jgi:flagellar protein FlaG
MNDSIASLGGAPDSTFGRGQRPQTSAETAEKTEPESGAEPADFRLIIEDDHADGALVYTTVNGRTGAVIQKVPRDQVLRMRDAKTYVAGQLIKTRA